jgi:hypothetical protein
MREKQVQVSAVNSIKKLLEEDAEKENQLIQSIKKVSKSLLLFLIVSQVQNNSQFSISFPVGGWRNRMERNDRKISTEANALDRRTKSEERRTFADRKKFEKSN